MNRDNDVSAVLRQYAAETGVHSVQKVEQDFVAIAQQVPAQEVTGGLVQAIHSEQTPPFDELMRQSFERADAGQRAAMLKRLLEGASPRVLSPLTDNTVLRYIARDEYHVVSVHADDAIGGLLSPGVFQQIAGEAAAHDPTVVDRMSEFYAVDPDAGRTLGGAALSVALGKMAETI